MTRSNLFPTFITATAAFLVPAGALAGSDAEAMIMESASAWQEAYNTGDTETGGSLYTEDALLMPPNQEVVVGRDAIAETFTIGVENGLTLNLDVNEIVVSGDQAHVLGDWQLFGPDGSQIDEGTFLEVRKKVDGVYLIHRDSYNSINPAVPADLMATQAAVNTFLQVWNTEEYDLLDAIIAGNFKRRAPTDLTDANGLDELKGVMQKLHTAYPDMTITNNWTEFYAGGAVISWTFAGTNTGPGDNPPTGNGVEIDGLTTIRMADGQIADEYVKFDALEWFTQLGYTLQVP